MLGEKLKAIRKENKLTQEQMAEKLHMSQPAYNKYENDKSSPSADLLKKISEVFNISADELLNYVGNNNAHFENGSTNQGNEIAYTNTYYTIPKEQFDLLLENQKQLASLIEKISAKLG
ncbi:MAG TPA: helix-turn-helix transcriptional regulator [Puia sp.]|nr:helix-turn-helix transcriptional regulator [Puia sp.]